MAPKKKNAIKKIIEWKADISIGLSDLDLWEAVERGREYLETDFYILVITKSYNYFYYPRKDCPEPEFDQTVFFYKKDIDFLKMIWSIPDKNTCYTLINAYKEKKIHKDQIKLACICEAFIEGDLDMYCKKLNKELP